jgi:hypothetical protein
MPAECSLVRRFLECIKGLAGPGLGVEIGTGRDTAKRLGLGDGGVEIVRVAGGGPLRLTDRFSRHRMDRPATED